MLYVGCDDVTYPSYTLKQLLWLPVSIITEHQPHRGMNMTVSFYLSFILLWVILTVWFYFTTSFWFFVCFYVLFFKNSVFILLVKRQPVILATDPSNPSSVCLSRPTRSAAARRRLTALPILTSSNVPNTVQLFLQLIYLHFWPDCAQLLL